MGPHPAKAFLTLTIQMESIPVLTILVDDNLYEIT